MPHTLPPNNVCGNRTRFTVPLLPRCRRPWPRSSARSFRNTGRICWTTKKPAGGWSRPSSAAKRASRPKGGRSRAERSTPGSGMASTSTSCTSSIDLLGSAPGQQVGGDQGGIVAALPLDAGHQRVGGRVGQLVEPALERGGRCFGIEPGGGDAFVAEEAL